MIGSNLSAVILGFARGEFKMENKYEKVVIELKEWLNQGIQYFTNCNKADAVFLLNNTLEKVKELEDKS